MIWCVDRSFLFLERRCNHYYAHKERVKVFRNLRSHDAIRTWRCQGRGSSIMRGGCTRLYPKSFRHLFSLLALQRFGAYWYTHVLIGCCSYGHSFLQKCYSFRIRIAGSAFPSNLIVNFNLAFIHSPLPSRAIELISGTGAV
jgi:hypothetical protein